MADEVHEDDFDTEEAIKSIKEPMTKFSDVWMLGEHMLLCGDSTKTESLDCLLGGDVVDMVFTDPPYNVAYEGGTKEALTIQNDNMSDAEFDIFLDDVFALVNKALKPGEFVFEPFGGSGSTLIACEQTKRRCRCIELDPKYCDVIVKRYIEFIGSNKMYM